MGNKSLKEKEDMQASGNLTPTMRNSKKQQTTYKGAFVGVNGNFTGLKLQKNYSTSSNNITSEEQRQEDISNSNDINYKNRRTYINRLGIQNKGSEKNAGTYGSTMIGNDNSQLYPANNRNFTTSTLVFRNGSEFKSDNIESIMQKEDIEKMNFEENAITDLLIEEDPLQDKNGIEVIISGKEEDSPNREELIEVVDSFIIPESDGYSLDFIQKNRTNDNIRRNFLSKLTYQKIWLTPLDKPKLHETAIIFDWDDTLLCTSFINPSGIYEHMELSVTVQQHIKLLEAVSIKMLQMAINYGKTFIITNAAEGWVQFSCQKFMPLLLPTLEKITIISARTRYEPHFPGDVTKWKLHAFLETQQNLDEAMITNIIALGDSMMEIDAAHNLSLKFQKALIKTVKFREFPKPNELVKQLNLVIQKFDEICNSPKNLTIRLEKKQQS